MTRQDNLTDREAEEAQLPERLTLHEAAFITPLSEDELRMALASAGVGSVSMVGRRSRARHAGRPLILVRTEDLHDAGLLERSDVSSLVPDPAPQPPPAGPPRSIWTDDESEGSVSR